MLNPAILGLKDPLIILVYLLCIASAALCVIYGLVNWNRGEEKVDQEDVHWAEEEDKVEEEF